MTWKAECGIPTLAELGYPEPEHPRRMTGGESAGLALLESSVARKAWVASFDKPSTAPTAFDPISTTGLSPYMKFGCVSARLFYSKVVPIYRSTPGSTKPPTSLEGQVTTLTLTLTLALTQATLILTLTLALTLFSP